jgi:cell wall-associated NlpC family hydrolase
MVSTTDLLTATDAPRGYQCRTALNLYSSPDLTSLATQAIAGRQLRILSSPQGAEAIAVCLVEDDYPGWLALEDVPNLEPVETPYQAIALTAADIQARLPTVVLTLLTWMNRPNCYLWGGTVGPDYDCSGLMQAAFLTQGIWLPRDAYQQADFTRATLSLTWRPELPTASGVPDDWFQPLQVGDLVFFGTPDRITHVGLYLGDRYYLHSSGQSQGRNGIGIDRLSPGENSISTAYYAQLRGAGRVTQSYQPTGQPQWRSP